MTPLISIPVHEEPEVIIDQIKNIQRFAPQSTVILHLSQGFRWGKHKEIDFSRFPNVLVNPEHVKTVWGGGFMLDVHISNFKYALKKGRFDYVILQSSNELFVKDGVQAYISTYDAGVYLRKIESDTLWYQGMRAYKDDNLRRMMTSAGIEQIYGCAHEGTFYKTDVFQKMVTVLEQFLASRAMSYPQEEIYFPTVASKFVRTVTHPLCYLHWENELNVTREDIRNIRANNFDQLHSEYVPINNLFTVKRVNRKVNDPLRTYIRFLCSLTNENKPKEEKSKLTRLWSSLRYRFP